MTTRGIFILETVRSRQREGSWVPTSNVFGRESLQQVGYVVGGSDSSDNSVSYYQAISYGSDTRSNVANLPQGRAGVYGVASNINGYNIGGGPGNPSQPNNTYYSSTSKLVFSTQTSSALPGANLTEPYGRGGSSGNKTAGYICGGYSGPGGESNGWSRLERLTYSSETMQRLPSSNIPGVGYGGATGWDHAATGNGEDFAVWIGGNKYPSPSSNLTGTGVWKLSFATEGWNYNGSWNLSGPGNRMQKAGMTSSDTGAYIVGGSYPANTRVQKISFADMTNSVVTNSASPGRTDLTATGNLSSGYFAGGATGNNANGTGGSVTSIVEKMNFSTNSISRVPALDLANGLSNVGSMSAAQNSPLPITQIFTGKNASFNFGYSMTGRKSPSWAAGPAMEFTYKVDYGTDTSAASPTAGASYGLEQASGAGNSTHGYKFGGRSNSVPGDGSNIVEKFIYATDTRVGHPNYANRRFGSFAVTNGETTLYGTGGRGQPSTQLHSNTYKMSYSTETWSDIPGASDHLDQSRKAGAALASSTHGYFAGGGDYPSTRSDVDKMDFSNDTMNKIPSMSLTVGDMDGNRGFGRGDVGYSMGGITNLGNYLSNMNKITFSTDTTSAFPSNLPDPVRNNQTMSNDSSGYATGGQGPSPSGWDRSTVSKMSYATETFSASGNLPTYQHYGIGMSAGSDNLPFQVPPTATPTAGQVLDTSATIPDAGYSMKGNTPGGLSSRISKIAFATDTKSNPGNMPTTGEHSADFSSLTAAYSNSGAKGPSGLTSNAQKVTYSTDSASNVPGGQHNGYQRQTGCSTMTHGYLAGGFTPGPSTSNFNKMDFSNETYTLLPAKIPSSGFPSPSGSTFMIGFNNSTVGYWGGGEGPGFPGGSSGVVKLTFATDTSSANPGNLPTILKQSASLGNGEVAGYTVSGAATLPGGGHISYTSKMLYSTETFSAVPGAYWNPVRYGMTTFSSFIAGYAGMGSESNDPFSKMPWSTETWSSTPGNFPSGSSNTRDTGGGTSAKSNSGGKPKVPVVL